MSQRIPVVLKLIRLRFLVGGLGERVGWWPSRFTGEMGLRQLSMAFPRTALRAAFESVSIAARRDHDDDARPLPPNSIHLFRLGLIQEDTIAHHLAQGSAQLKIPPETTEEILAELDDMGPPDQASPPVGPCSLGKEQRVRKNAAVKDLARVYAATARSGQRAIPYFEVIR